MTTGIATHSALDTAWLTRTLAAAEYTDVRVDDRWVMVTTETGCIHIGLDDRAGLLRFSSALGVGADTVPAADEERGTALGLLQRILDVARIAYYTGTAQPLVRAEYDVPILAGLSRAQFLSMLRAFTSDVAIAMRYV